MITSTLERILLGVFIIVNIAMYFYSYDNATFVEAADAAQYYGPSLSFIEHGEFLSGEGVLFTFGTPLYSIFIAGPISIFGIENSASIIVFMQATILYLTGLLSRQILLQFSNKFGLLLHALIIFNPNSLITAHLIQSETLFTFFLIWSVVLAFKVINNFSLRNILFLGVLAGTTTLVRPVGLYLLLMWPIFIFIVLIIKNRQNDNQINFSGRPVFIKLLGVTLIGIMVISPWYVRNYIEFEEFFLTTNSGAYLKAQYIQIRNKGSGQSVPDANEEHKIKFGEYLTKEEMSKFCLDNERHWSCNNALTQASLNAIIEEPFTSHIRALIDSWATLFFSGGASNIRNYLGLDGKALIVSFQNNEFNGIESIIDLIKSMNFHYLLVFIITTIFSLVTRIIGVLGVFYLLKNKIHRPYGMLLVEIVSIFTAAYLYLGQSRFRVPLEPFLMIFTVVGILYTVKILKFGKK